MANTDFNRRATLSEIAHQDWGRLVAALIASLRDFQLAEDCLQEAFASAITHWERGMPDNPQGWLLQTARRKAIDKIRRQQNFAAKLPDLTHLIELDQLDSQSEEAHEIPDERLRLIFTACHPALDQKTQVALTLRTLCGLTTAEIAGAFLDKETAMAQRLVRARQKIAKAGIAYEVPGPDTWGERLDAVLTVIYLIFNEGYSGNRDLVHEAMRLAYLVDRLRPNEPEVAGLIALMELTRARAPARFDDTGAFVPLENQDRKLWDHQTAKQGRARLEAALRLGRPGPFQLQGAIAAVHSEAENFEETRWYEIRLIYERLMEMRENPVIRLNHAVAVSYAANPQEALELLDALSDDLVGYQSFHAARADCLLRSGAWAAAIESFDYAIELTDRPAERRYLEEKRDRTKKEAEQSSAQVQQGG